MSNVKLKNIFFIIIILLIFFISKSNFIAKQLQIVVMLLCSIAFFKCSLKSTTMAFIFVLYLLISALSSNLVISSTYVGYLLYGIYLIYIIFIIEDLSHYRPSPKVIGIVKELLFVLITFNTMFFFFQLSGYQGSLNYYFYGDLSERSHWMTVRPSGFLGNSNITALVTLFVFTILSGTRKYLVFLYILAIIFAVEPMMVIILTAIYMMVKANDIIKSKYIKISALSIMGLFIMFYVFYSGMVEEVTSDFSFLHRLDTLLNLKELSWNNILLGGYSVSQYMLDNDFKYLDNVIAIMVINIGIIGIFLYLMVFYNILKDRYDSLLIVMFFVQQITFPLISNFPILFLILLCARVKKIESANNASFLK